MLLESLVAATSLAVGISLCIILIYLLQQYIEEKVGVFFLLLIVFTLVWAVAFMLEMMSPDKDIMVLSAKVEYVGISFVPVAWFSFCSAYAGKFDSVVRGRSFYFLAVVPLITIFLVFTNESHGLIWSETGFSSIGVYRVLTPAHGAWFWVHAAYSYLLIAVGSVLIVWKSLFVSSAHRRRSVILVSAVVLPWVANAGYLLKITGFDYTVLTFVASIFLLFLGVYGQRLLGVIPVARNKVVEGLDDAVVVLDKGYRVVDMNPSAERLLRIPMDKAVGLEVAEVFRECPEIISLCKSGRSGKKDMCTKMEGDSERYYNVKVSPLYDKSQKILGRLVVVRDVTEIKQTENELKEKIEELERYKRVTVGRELRMIELKKQIEELQRELSGGKVDVSFF